MATPQKIRILVIDDEEAVRETLCENLIDCGFEVYEAIDGEQGIDLIRPDNLPHIVITDIIMPRKEGIETIMEMRKKYPAIKLIAISGGGRMKSMDFLHLAERVGANSVFPKPINVDELAKVIRQLAG